MCSCTSVFLDALFNGYAGDVGVNAVVPVQEAGQINGIAELQTINSLVNIGVLATQVGLHTHVVGLAVHGDVEVQVAAGGAGAVPVVQESGLLAFTVGGSSNGSALNSNIAALREVGVVADIGEKEQKL